VVSFPRVSPPINVHKWIILTEAYKQKNTDWSVRCLNPSRGKRIFLDQDRSDLLRHEHSLLFSEWPGFFPGVTRQECDVCLSPLTTEEYKNECSCISTPCICGQGQLYLTPLYGLRSSTWHLYTEQYTGYCSCIRNSTQVTAAVYGTVHRLLYLYTEQYTGNCICIRNSTQVTAAVYGTVRRLLQLYAEQYTDYSSDKREHQMAATKVIPMCHSSVVMDNGGNDKLSHWRFKSCSSGVIWINGTVQLRPS
jgi:hypothetical protein